MIESDIIGNPLFQLNLVLWLSWSFPTDSTIDPIFFRAGYRLSSIETELTVPPGSSLILRDSNIGVSRAARPEAILEHQEHQLFLTLECKASSFSPQSSTAKQAVALLTLNGNELSDLLGKPHSEIWNGILTYVSVQGQGNNLMSTLQDLSITLARCGIATPQIASLELSHQRDGIYIMSVPGSTSLPNVDLSRRRRVLQLNPNEDPRSLYLIPYMPGGEHERDSIAEQEFGERMRLAVAMLFGHLNEQQHDYDLDEVIGRTIQVWHQWRNEPQKTNIRDHARHFIRSVFRDIQKVSGVECQITKSGRIVTIPAVSGIEADKIRGYIRSTAFRRKPLNFSGRVQGQIADFLDQDDE
jgi:hypothetical protein